MSPIFYNDATGQLVMLDEHHCQVVMTDTGCMAPGCTGFRCEVCGLGCDIEQEPTTGGCALALEAETEEEFLARANRERAAFGLPPVQ